MVTAWIKRVWEPGGSVSSQVVITIAHGILTSLEGKNQENLEVMWIWIDIGTFPSNWNELCSYLEEGNNNKEQIFWDKFCRKKERNLEEIRATLLIKQIPLKLILNWDQTEIKLVP